MRGCFSAGSSISRSLHFVAQPRPQRYSTVANARDIPPAAHLNHLNRQQRERKEQLLKRLDTSLHHDKNPSRVFRLYKSTITQLDLPLEVHQLALRKCTTTLENLRNASARRPASNVPRTPHDKESRFRFVVRGMIASGVRPTRDDFNYILREFAMVGNHLGCLEILKEMENMGIEPSAGSYGMLLQAIAHRLTLPSRVALKAQRIAVARRSLDIVLDALRTKPHLIRSVNFDLVLRIVKTTHDMQTFEWLVKWGYGIDLATPDQPINPWDTPGQGLLPVPDYPHILSVAALNTILEKLGSIGNISKMVQTFEVLTTPGPHVQKYHMLDSFDEDEDDYGAVPEDTYVFPSVAPNTTTYAILLRYVSRLNNRTLSRHYLHELYASLKRWSHTFAQNLRILGSDTPSPILSITRDHILSVFGLANRSRHVRTMTWLELRLFPGVLKLKRKMLKEAETHRKRLGFPRPKETQKPVFVTPTFSSPQTTPPGFLANTASAIWAACAAEGKECPVLPETEKKFVNLNLHIRLLERDIKEIETLQAHVKIIRERTVQRVKEGLGRRVWQGKDVFMSNRRRRVHVSREHWKKTVNFRPLSEEAEWYRPGRKMMKRFKVIVWNKYTKYIRSNWRRRWGMKRPTTRRVFLVHERKRLGTRLARRMQAEGATEEEIKAAVDEVTAVPEKRKTLKQYRKEQREMAMLARIGGIIPRPEAEEAKEQTPIVARRVRTTLPSPQEVASEPQGDLSQPQKESSP